MSRIFSVYGCIDRKTFAIMAFIAIWCWYISAALLRLETELTFAIGYGMFLASTWTLFCLVIQRLRDIGANPWWVALPAGLAVVLAIIPYGFMIVPPFLLTLAIPASLKEQAAVNLRGAI